MQYVKLSNSHCFSLEFSYLRKGKLYKEFPQRNLNVPMKPVQKATRPSCRIVRQIHEFRLTRLNIQTGNIKFRTPR